MMKLSRLVSYDPGPTESTKRIKYFSHQFYLPLANNFHCLIHVKFDRNRLNSYLKNWCESLWALEFSLKASGGQSQLKTKRMIANFNSILTGVWHWFLGVIHMFPYGVHIFHQGGIANRRKSLKICSHSLTNYGNNFKWKKVSDAETLLNHLDLPSFKIWWMEIFKEIAMNLSTVRSYLDK